MTTPAPGRRHARRAALALLIVLAAPARPSGAQGTKEDYARAEGLRALTNGKVFKARVDPHWFADDARFWYRNDLAGGRREFVLVDAEKGDRKPAFDHEALAKALGKAAGKEVDAAKFPFDRVVIEDDGSVRFEANDKPWKFDPRSGEVKPGEPLPKEPAAPPERPGRGAGAANFRGRATSPRREGSPDGKWTAFVKDHNVYLREKESGKEFALSEEGTEGDRYDGGGVFWSPDSSKLVATRTAKGDDRRVNLVESSPKDQLQPKLSWYDYLKPGDRVPVTKPHLFDVATRQEIKISDKLFDNPYDNDRVRWFPDSSRFTFLHNQRGHQALRLLSVDAKTGEVTPVVDESSKTFIDYAHKTFLHFLGEGDDLLWMSERDGWNHLYRYDARAATLKNQVTKGDWVVLGVEHVDEDAGRVWFRVGGVKPEQDPYYVHLARVNLDGSGFRVMTEGDGTHRVAFSPKRKYFLDTYSRVDLPPVTVLRSSKDGAALCELEKADASALGETPWREPERFTAKGRDGETDIYGLIYRPTTFDPSKKYAVIEAIYAGPQGAFVPKAFAAFHPAQGTAELGFVVVQIDGMGTNWRSKAFHDVCWKNLGDAGFPDRIAWMKAAAEKYPFMDLSRVGVYGGSAGGQNAMGALLFHGDFYKAAAADCGCHDNRMDKIWWNEAWMGWPLGPHYEASSNVVNADKLRGKLLLTVGELDHNVDPASTMQVVNALIKAGKDFEFVVFPGADHGAGSGRYGGRRRNDFFVRNLLGVEPPDRNSDASSPVEPVWRRTAALNPEVKPAAETAAPRVALKPAGVAAPGASGGPAVEPVEVDHSPAEMRGVVEKFTADFGSLRRSLPPDAGDRRARLKAFYEGWLDAIKSLDFDSLGRPGRVDYVLLRGRLEHDLNRLAAEENAAGETAPLVPFAKQVARLADPKSRAEGVDPAKAAGDLDALAKAVKDARKAVDALRKENDKDGGTKIPKSVAVRASRETEQLRTALRDWHRFFDGYDPAFTWWTAEPYKAADAAISGHASYLRETVGGVSSRDGDEIIGDPIGRRALLDELAYAMVPYTPEQLVVMANKEFAWCEAEMKKASNEMGFGDDWKAALEKVKTKFVEPGKQPKLIRDLAEEAVRFLDDHDLVTIPDLARESWRMEMMTPQRQLVNPFFTGGETISVSFPTSTMTHEQKLMSMRGNNVHFSRATVHHELIPGHHLQGFVADRSRPYRRAFNTPFLVEGWALYWELLLWDMKFPPTPEDRVGMLFWRMHRCARIVFSLSFHLGKMTPQECIDFLVDRVGHERDNATAEVRRSFAGNYGPLYQCAYMLGGLQLRALRGELVGPGKMTDRAFHDAVLRENAIPVEMIRAGLTDVPIPRDYTTRWTFYGDVGEN